MYFLHEKDGMKTCLRTAANSKRSLQLGILSLTSLPPPYSAVILNGAFVKIKLKKVQAEDSVEQKIYTF